MAKNIVICLDGTGKKFSENNTNVVHTVSLLIKNNQQVICYDPGVGTFDFLGKARRKSGMSLLLGKTFGYGLKLNILDGYKFLMRHSLYWTKNFS